MYSTKNILIFSTKSASRLSGKLFAINSVAENQKPLNDFNVSNLLKVSRISSHEGRELELSSISHINSPIFFLFVSLSFSSSIRSKNK